MRRSRPLFLALVYLSLSACAKHGGTSAPAIASAKPPEEQVLNLFIWNDYLAPEHAGEF